MKKPEIPHRGKLLDWVNQNIPPKHKIKTIEQIGTGVALAHLLHRASPTCIHISKIRSYPKNIYENVSNLKHVFQALEKLRIPTQGMDIDKMAQCKYQHNFLALQKIYSSGLLGFDESRPSSLIPETESWFEPPAKNQQLYLNHSNRGSISNAIPSTSLPRKQSSSNFKPQSFLNDLKILPHEDLLPNAFSRKNTRSVFLLSQRPLAYDKPILAKSPSNHAISQISHDFNLFSRYSQSVDSKAGSEETAEGKLGSMKEIISCEKKYATYTPDSKKMSEPTIHSKSTNALLDLYGPLSFLEKSEEEEDDEYLLGSEAKIKISRINSHSGESGSNEKNAEMIIMEKGGGKISDEQSSSLEQKKKAKDELESRQQVAQAKNEIEVKIEEESMRAKRYKQKDISRSKPKQQCQSCQKEQQEKSAGKILEDRLKIGIQEYSEEIQNLTPLENLLVNCHLPRRSSNKRNNIHRSADSQKKIFQQTHNSQESEQSLRSLRRIGNPEANQTNSLMLKPQINREALAPREQRLQVNSKREDQL